MGLRRFAVQCPSSSRVAGRCVCGVRCVQWRVCLACLSAGVLLVVGGASRLGVFGRPETPAACSALVCPSSAVGPARVWGVRSPGVVHVGLHLCGLLVAGVLMMPTVWSLHVM